MQSPQIAVPSPMAPHARRTLDLINSMMDIFSGEEDGQAYLSLLPRICVCGNQSAGKSSLLSAIVSARMVIDGQQAQFEFLPSADGTCTRCPCIVQMMAVEDSRSTAEVISGHGRPVLIDGPLSGELNKADLDRFGKKIQDAIAAAQTSIIEQSDTKHISSAPITLKLRGPLFPCVTLVDLPGLVRNNTDQRTGHEIPGLKQGIEDMVMKEVKNKATIMLCVSSATDETNMSEAIGLQKKFDPNFNRSVPVFTKTDKLLKDDMCSHKDILKEYIDFQRKANASAMCFGTCNPPPGFAPVGPSSLADLGTFFGMGNFGNIGLRQHLELTLAQHIRFSLPSTRKRMDKDIIDLQMVADAQDMSWVVVGELVALFAHAVHRTYESANQKSNGSDLPSFIVSKATKKQFSSMSMQKMMTHKNYKRGIDHINNVDVYRKAATHAQDEYCVLSMPTEELLEKATEMSMQGGTAINLDGNHVEDDTVAGEMADDLTTAMVDKTNANEEPDGIRTSFDHHVVQPFRTLALSFLEHMAQTEVSSSSAALL